SKMGIGVYEPERQIEIEQTLNALLALKQGDFNVRLPAGWTGIDGKIADVFNDIAQILAVSTSELNRISPGVGDEGRIQERHTLAHNSGGWAERVNSVNSLIERLAKPVMETARVIGAVAKGDLSQTMEVEIDGRKLRGEFLRSATALNRMVKLLST